MSVKPLKTHELQAAIERPGVLLIDLWAPWCAPCRLFAPIYQAVADRHPDVTFAQVNVDEEPAVATAFGVRGIPTLVAMRDGIPVFVQAGMLPETSLDLVVGKVKALDMDALRARLSADDDGSPG
jgi:thioredoxin 1